MKGARIIRIIALLLLIFAAGVVTGRLTAPKTRALILNARGDLVTSATALNRLKVHLKLSPEQEEQFAELFEEVAVELSRLPPRSTERLETFKRYVPQMEALLKPEQLEDLHKYVAQTERNFMRAIRRGGR